MRVARTALVTRTRGRKVTCNSADSRLFWRFSGGFQRGRRNRPPSERKNRRRSGTGPTSSTPPPPAPALVRVFRNGLHFFAGGRRGGRSGFGRGMRGITNRLSRWCADRTSWAAAAVDRRSGEWSDPQACERSAAVPTVCAAPRSVEPRSDSARARPTGGASAEPVARQSAADRRGASAEQREQRRGEL